MLAGNAMIKHYVMFEMMRNSSLMRNCRLTLLNQVLYVLGWRTLAIVLVVLGQHLQTIGRLVFLLFREFVYRTACNAFVSCMYDLCLWLPIWSSCKWLGCEEALPQCKTVGLPLWSRGYAHGLWSSRLFHHCGESTRKNFCGIRRACAHGYYETLNVAENYSVMILLFVHCMHVMSTHSDTSTWHNWSEFILASPSKREQVQYLARLQYTLTFIPHVHRMAVTDVRHGLQAPSNEDLCTMNFQEKGANFDCLVVYGSGCGFDHRQITS